jgi:5-methylcytosine-specific restriction endonuclease McrA
MARSRYDIANSAIRIFLQDVGKFYDQARGFSPFVPKVAQADELLSFFGGECCYCGASMTRQSVSLDHLIPMNKAALGLHAWGNVVPCCQACNNEKQQTGWAAFLARKASGSVLAARHNRIVAFVAEKKYDPNLDLHEYADNLYEDVGAVAMTLIQLRYQQAEARIRQLLEPNQSLQPTSVAQVKSSDV